MTNLIERFTVTWELNHDRTPETSTVYGGPHESKPWTMLHDLFGDKKGSLDLGNGMTVRWESTGLEEAPEESGGDN